MAKNNVQPPFFPQKHAYSHNANTQIQHTNSHANQPNPHPAIKFVQNCDFTVLTISIFLFTATARNNSVCCVLLLRRGIKLHGHHLRVCVFCTFTFQQAGILALTIQSFSVGRSFSFPVFLYVFLFRSYRTEAQNTQRLLAAATMSLCELCVSGVGVGWFGVG